MSNSMTKKQTTQATAANTNYRSAPVDILENEHQYRLLFDMPGVDNHDVSIEFDKGKMQVEAIRKEAAGINPWQGKYRRWFELPHGIDQEKASAMLKDGVLTVELPKHESARVRRIAVQKH